MPGDPQPALIIFSGGRPASPIEDMVLRAQRAIARDTIERALSARAFGRVILVTDSLELAGSVTGDVEIELDTGPFHFGRRLKEIIDRYGLERPFYAGAGSMALLDAEQLAALAYTLANAERKVIANNLYSADWVAFTPGSAIHEIELPSADNPLALRLRDQAGLRDACPPRTPATQFDVDTPADLLVLKVHPGVGVQARRYVESLPLDDSRLRAALRFFKDPQAEVLIAGRVGSHLWSYLETETACRVRLFSEERGMRSDGREERGEVRSLLGFHLEMVGPYKFFRTLAELGDAAFLDTRVLFHHLHLALSAADRFLSDLGRVDEISHPFLREFTQAAVEAPIPVVLGGHSLVSGGLWAIVDAAWKAETNCALPERVL